MNPRTQVFSTTNVSGLKTKIKFWNTQNSQKNKYQNCLEVGRRQRVWASINIKYMQRRNGLFLDFISVYFVRFHRAANLYYMYLDQNISLICFSKVPYVSYMRGLIYYRFSCHESSKDWR